MIITDAINEDLDALMELNQSVLPERYPRFMWQAFLKEPHKTIVIKDPENQGNKPVGYIVIDRYDPSRIYISSIAVATEYQSKGLASWLLRHVFSLYPTDTFYLHVRKKNLRAIALYNRFGFEITQILKDYYIEPLDDGLLMTRE